MPPYLVITEVTLAKLSFSELMSIQSYGEKAYWVDLAPLPPFGIRKAKALGNNSGYIDGEVPTWENICDTD